MDQQVKDKLCKQIDNEIEKIANMPALNDTTLNNLYKLIDVKKDLLEIDEKEMELGMDEYPGNSMRGPIYGGSYRGGQGGGSNRGGQGGGGGGNSRRPSRYYDDGYSMNNSYGGNSYDNEEREMIRRQMMGNGMY